MIINQGDLVLLPYPFSDLKGAKVRPALVVSNKNFNDVCQDFILLPLTSILREIDYSFIISENDLSTGKLIKTSSVRIDKIFSVRKDLVKFKIGSLKKDVFEKIKVKINNLF